MDNYKVIEEKLKRYEPFRGNTLEAFWDAISDNYVVFSYRTKIAEYNPAVKSTVFDPSQMSVTTSKHQSIIARAWGFPPVSVLRKNNDPNKFVGPVLRVES